MLILVINLDRAPERLAHMDGQLSALGVPYERLPAVDGRTLDPAYVAKFAPMAASQVGCYLSHKAAWQRIADGGDAYGIVLEDDIHIAPAFADFAGSTDWIPPDAGIVKFETMTWLVSVDETPHSTWHGCALRRLRSFHPGAAAYLLTARGAGLLLARHAEPTEPADDAVFYVDEPWRHLPPVYQVDPGLCIQDMAIRSRPNDPRLTSMQEIKRRQHKSLAHRTIREARQFCRWISGIASCGAAAMGSKPPSVKKIIPFAGK